MKFTIVILIAFSLLGQIVSATTFGRRFQNTLIINSVLSLPNGEIFIAASGGPGPSPQPVLIRLTAEGRIVWCFQYFLGQGYYGAFRKILKAESSDTFYVIGERAKTNNDESDPLLLKFNGKGEIIWKRTIVEPFSDYFYDLIMDPNGLIVVGESGSFGQDQTGAWVLKFSKGGSVQWSQVFDRGFVENFKAILPTDDGGYILAGTTDIFTSALDGFKGSIVKINANGNYMWDKVYSAGVGGFLNIFAASRLVDKNFVLVGDISRKNAEPNALILKINPSGGILWKKAIGGSGVEHALAVLPLADGRIAAVGETTLSFPPGRDGFVGVLSNGGALTSSNIFGDEFDDDLQFITHSQDGGFLLSGNLYTPLIPSASEFNSVVLKLNSSGVLDAGCNFFREGTLPISQASVKVLRRQLRKALVAKTTVSFYSLRKSFRPRSALVCN